MIAALFIITLGDVVGLVVMGLILVCVILFAAWAGIEWCWKKLRGRRP